MLQSSKHTQQWSKFKSQLQSLWSDPIKDRIDIHATVYRESHDSLGKIWITFDKEIIFEANTLEKDLKLDKTSSELNQWECLDEIYNFLNKPFEESLKKQNKLTKILCLIDRRLGKRRLITMEKEYIQFSKLYSARINKIK